MHSLDMVNENIKKIGNLFPECVTETVDENGNIKAAIDFEKLQENLSHATIGEGEERYQFTWPGKREAIHNANAPTNMTLRPCKEESVDFDNTENLYIEGDNLEVLKLLQENYLGKVKMIYIDPPYNTGNDFVYNDDFKEDTESFQSKSGMYDEDGNMLMQNFEKNTESNGRFHTDWLNMMYPRLKIARNLLSDDGVIFISIDDNEIENLRKICDEIFGNKNFFCNIIIQSNKRGQTYKQISKTHEYLLIYTKSEFTEFNELEKSGDSDDLNLTDNISPFNIRELRNRNPKFGRFNRPGLFYPIYVNPNVVDKDGFCPISLTESVEYSQKILPLNSANGESCWRWGKEKFNENNKSNTLDSNVVAKAKQGGGFNIYEKYRKTTYKAKSIWDEVDVITEKGTVELGTLSLSQFFPFPKPIALVKKSLLLGTSQDDVILDFFSGSATTAHAVMQVNAEDGGSRKFICVQLPEATAEDSEAYKAGYKNICEIGKERIRRAGKKIKEEFGEKAKDLDIGFRVLKLADSNMKDVYYSPAETDSADIFDVNNVKEDRTPLDLLFQVMPECNLPLSSKIEERTIEGKTVYFVNGSYLVACFDEGITEKLIKSVIDVPDSDKPYYFYMRNLGLESDKVLDNFEQLFVHYSPSTKRKVI